MITLYFIPRISPPFPQTERPWRWQRHGLPFRENFPLYSALIGTNTFCRNASDILPSMGKLEYRYCSVSRLIAKAEHSFPLYFSGNMIVHGSRYDMIEEENGARGCTTSLSTPVAKSFSSPINPTRQLRCDLILSRQLVPDIREVRLTPFIRHWYIFNLQKFLFAELRRFWLHFWLYLE